MKTWRIVKKADAFALQYATVLDSETTSEWFFLMTPRRILIPGHKYKIWFPDIKLWYDEQEARKALAILRIEEEQRHLDTNWTPI